VLVSGNNQTGIIGSELTTPLVAQVLDATGTPVANQTVIFNVTQNNGTVRTVSSQAPTVTVPADTQGKAQVFWTLGMRSGPGNMVEATAAGFTGVAVFTATGSPTNAAQINMDAGSNQTGAVGQPLPHPFIAVVTDAGNNRVPNVPVTFTVKQGGGSFSGQSNITSSTDSDGRVAAILTLGSQDGIENNVVEATFSGNVGFPAAFTASGRIPGDPAATRITGVVLDNSNAPVPGVTIRAFLNNAAAQASLGLPPNIAVQADAQGQFTIQPAPVGFVKLIADGSTAQRPGKWPNLEYELVTVAGQNNPLGLPIYLLPLDTGHGLCVTPTTGGTLTLPQVPGFSLTVLPGSAIFPGGSRTGCVSVTTVHPDKIPMPPGFGQQPRFIVTIQPAGTQFSPPAAITIPNAEGLAPRTVTEMYSFDHDLGTFVSIGTATVSQDGTIMASDTGVGVLKAGWLCGGNSSPTGSAGTCPDCQKCQGSACVGDPQQASHACFDSQHDSGYCENGGCHSCPSITSLLSLQVLPLLPQFPTLQTGIGAVATMQLGPIAGGEKWLGVELAESLSVDQSNTTCPHFITRAGMQEDIWGCSGTNTFFPGIGKTIFGVPFPAQDNTFYDEHTFTAGFSVIDFTGLNTCRVVCLQDYSCKGQTLGSYTIIKTLTKSVISGRDVTLVDVTKTPR
jgi:hypothetical protein